MGDTQVLPELQDFPDTSPPPPDLAPVINSLHGSNAEVVVRDDLVAAGIERGVDQAIRCLRDRGWLYSLPVQGRGGSRRAELHRTWRLCHLAGKAAVSPDAPICVGGRSVAQARNWLRRTTAPTVGFRWRGRPPRCLAEYAVAYWQPRIPLDVIHGLGVWKPETLVSFMGTRPGKFPWTDIAEWLWEMCESVDPMLVAANLTAGLRRPGRARRTSSRRGRTRTPLTPCCRLDPPPETALLLREETGWRHPDALAAGVVRQAQGLSTTC